MTVVPSVVYFSDFSLSDLELISAVQDYTMTSPERLFALIRAVEYITKYNIPGDIVECGVWRGGSMMAVAKTLLKLGDTSRHLHLFDTFEGMSPPSEYDVSFAGEKAAELLDEQAAEKQKSSSIWCYASLEEVRNAVLSTGYPTDKIHFVKGKVEETIPTQAPEKISLLRLDTDWYESTQHELIHLFPRLAENGVIIIDDYGHWEGARKAVDEYFALHNIPILLNRVDYTARIGLKTFKGVVYPLENENKSPQAKKFTDATDSRQLRNPPIILIDSSFSGEQALRPIEDEKAKLLKSYGEMLSRLRQQEILISELYQGKEWLEKQWQNWQSAAQQLEQALKEQAEWVDQLEQGKKWLEEQWQNWQAIALQREQTMVEQSRRIKELEQAIQSK